MPSHLEVPVNMPQLQIKPLNQQDFAPFGTVIQNPMSDKSVLPPAPEIVNQGTAFKFSNLTEMVNLYGLAPSRRRGRAVINLFVCRPRSLTPAGDGGEAPAIERGNLLPIKILERHPFTTQTFIPLGSGSGNQTTRYLVIVAPSLPLRRERGSIPPPFPTAESRGKRSLKELLSRARQPPFPEREPKPIGKTGAKTTRIPRPGLPDLLNIKAFISEGSQAVTYGPGVWHAPMAVLGSAPAEFVVVQFANDVAGEDCQELQLVAKEDDQGIVVALPSLEEPVATDRPAPKAKL